MKKQKGFTIVELAISMGAGVLLLMLIGAIVTGIHFIVRAW